MSRGVVATALRFLIPVNIDRAAGLRGSLARVTLAQGLEQDATGGQKLVGSLFKVAPELVGQSEIVAEERRL